MTQKCKFHPETPATVWCAGCDAPLCEACTQAGVAGLYCPNCIAQEASSIASQATVPSGRYAEPASAPASAVLPSGNDIRLLSEIRGLNFGAFWFTWLWCFLHRLTSLGVVLLILPFVPFVGWLLDLGFAIYLLFKGNELAWSQRPFLTLIEFRAVQRAWRNWAIVVLLLTLALAVLAYWALNTRSW